MKKTHGFHGWRLLLLFTILTAGALWILRNEGDERNPDASTSFSAGTVARNETDSDFGKNTPRSQSENSPQANTTVELPLAANSPSPDLKPFPGSKGIGGAFHQSNQPEFANFSTWTERYAKAPATDREAMVGEGVALAESRRSALKTLITTDPEKALSLAIPLEERKQLPGAVEEKLEEYIQSTGRYYVMGVTPLRGKPMPKEPIIRSLVFGSAKKEVSTNAKSTASLNASKPQTESAKPKKYEYRVYPTGKMRDFLNRENLAVEGIAVDSTMAARHDHDHDHDHGDFFNGMKAWGDPSIGTDAMSGKPDPAWTTGTKKMLLIRVDFSDMPGSPANRYNSSIPLTPEFAVDVFFQADGLQEFFQKNSYNNTGFSFTTADVSPVYRMPQTGVYYAVGDGDLPYTQEMADSAFAAAQVNYDFSQYDRICLIFPYLSDVPGSNVGFAGVGVLQGKNLYLNGVYNFDVLGHELAHTYGIVHANWWKPADNSSIGTEADMNLNFYNGQMGSVSQEYLDRYDIMGGLGPFNPPPSSTHFNAWFKSILSWLPNSAVQNAETPGIYRVYRHDHPSADLVNHKLALKIGRDPRRQFWVSHRKLPFPGTNMNSGACIQFGYFENRSSDLIVCNNPGVDITNAALEVGQSLVDTASGVTFTTVGIGGTSPNEWVDVQVDIASRISFQTSLVDFQTNVGLAPVIIERTGGSDGTTTAQYSCEDGTAVSGTHYTAISGTLTWEDGDTTTRTIYLPVTPYSAFIGETNLVIKITNVTNGVAASPNRLNVSLRPPGNPDLSYYPDVTNDGLKDISRQPDGKILIGGRFTMLAHYGQSVSRYARITADGKKDTTFETVNGADAAVYVIEPQPDGKILLGGDFTTIKSTPRNFLARLNNDGTLDASFVPPTLDQKVLDIAVQPDGKIWVCGYFRNVNGQPCHGLCRLNPNGSLDFRFYNADYSFPANFGGTRSIALDNYSNAGGVRIVAGGNLNKHINSYADPQSSLIRLNPDGSIDNTFNVGKGAHSRGFPTVGAQINCVSVQADGKIVVAGEFTAFGESKQKYLARLNSDGSVDSSFAPGITSANNIPRIFTMAVQPDGKVAFGGVFDKVNGMLNRNLARVSATGALDTTWDNGTDHNNGTIRWTETLFLRPDGRMMVGIENIVGDFLPGGIRGAKPPFTNMSGGWSTAALYTGLAPSYGLGHFEVASADLAPNGTINVVVKRSSGSTGAVKLDYGIEPGTAVESVDYTNTQGTLSWADGDGTSKTISVTSLPGATIGRTLKLNLAIPKGGIQLGYPASLPITINNTSGFFGGPFLPLQQGGENPPTLLSGSAANSLLLHAFGSEGGNASEADKPEGGVEGDRLRIVFKRNPALTNVVYEVEGSDDLREWTTLARSSGGNPTVNLLAHEVSEITTGEMVEVTLTDSFLISNKPHRSLRLRIINQ